VLVAPDVPAWLARVGGLRAEAAQVDIESRVLHVKRLKAGLSTTHPLRGDELRMIKLLTGCEFCNWP
jgi:hypothetical protein